jgi:hypothetical protein
MATTHKRIRWATTVLALAMTALGIGVFGAPQAYAGSSCSFGCSQTYNQSPYSVYTAHNWCDSGSYHGPCQSGNSYLWIGPGSSGSPTHTPLSEDWDTFRVDAGWCYKVTITHDYGLWSSNHTYDQRGKGALWIQIHNDETGIVRSQSTSGC